jgi:hypothetical protein
MTALPVRAVNHAVESAVIQPPCKHPLGPHTSTQLAETVYMPYMPSRSSIDEMPGMTVLAIIPKSSLYRLRCARANAATGGVCSNEHRQMQRARMDILCGSYEVR